jgi:hypothetical protein
VYNTSVLSSSFVTELGVSLAEFFSADPSVAARTVATKVNSNKHVAAGQRRTHEGISMVSGGVFGGKHL